MSWCVTAIWSRKGTEVAWPCSLMTIMYGPNNVLGLQPAYNSSVLIVHITCNWFLASSCWYSILFVWSTNLGWSPVDRTCYLDLASLGQHIHMACLPTLPCYEGVHVLSSRPFKKPPMSFFNWSLSRCCLRCKLLGPTCCCPLPSSPLRHQSCSPHPIFVAARPWWCSPCSESSSFIVLVQCVHRAVVLFLGTCLSC
jgi:hypothetical protein